MNLILWLHPVLQAVATIMAVYVLYHGATRFYCVLFNKRKPFPWKSHVYWGRITVILWFAGLVLGYWAARKFWTVSGTTGSHYIVGLTMLPLLVVGYATGEIMDRKKKKRTILPMVHAINNFLLFGLALFQLVSGIPLLSWLPR